MSKSNAFEGDILDLYFNAIPIPNLADDAAVAPATSLSVALHTSDPGEGGDQTTNETAYTGYARVNVVRSAAGWVRTGSSVSPAADIDFPKCTASPGGPITHFSVGTGVGDKLDYSGTVTDNITMLVNTIPRLETTSTITED
jgi:hypothetical protein